MEKSVCFMGHRTIDDTPELRAKLHEALTEFIDSGTINFLFGDHSDFNDLCYDMVTELQQIYPQIRRIHVRTYYENAGEYTMQFILSGFEDSICPEGISKAGKASYVIRNRMMIDESEICVFYYKNDYLPPQDDNPYIRRKKKSGTDLAYQYAEKKNKKIINVLE